MKQRAMTLIEVMSVVAIVATLTALLMPVVDSAKVAAKRSSSLSRMRQIYAGLMVYQADHESQGYGSPAKMGLPAMEQLLLTSGRACPSVPPNLWMSPCGYHPLGPAGFWSYSYHPAGQEENPGWVEFVNEHQGRAPLVSDLACSDVRGHEDSPLITKSVPFITLEGRASVKRGIGLPIDPDFFVQ